MPAIAVNPPFPLFTDADGQPLDDAYIYIGTANQNPVTNPITVYWDAALTITAAQPIRTSGGYPVYNGTPARFYTNSDYSILVRDKNGAFIYTAPSETDFISSEFVTFIQSGAGAVTRTAQNKMRDVVSVKDFGAVCDWNGTTGTDDTQAIQDALDYAYSLPGMVEVINPGASKVTATLILGSNVIFRGGSLTCTTNNIPIIRVSKDALNSYWQIRDMSLVYQNAQSSGGTGNAIQLANTNVVSYEYEISNVSVNNARSAVCLPSLTGAFVFLGRHINIRSFKGTGPAFEIIGSGTGAHTTLTFIDCYYQGESGAEISTASLFDLRRVTGLTVDQCACDRTAKSSGALAYFESCSGGVGSIVAEGNLLSRASGVGAFYEFSDCRGLVIDQLVATANTVTLTGSGDFGFIRAVSSSRINCGAIRDLNNVVFDSSSGGYFTVVIDSASVLFNDFFQATGTSPALSTNESSSTDPTRFARTLNGSTRTGVEAGKLVMFATAPPSTGTFALNDRVRNIAVSGASPVTEWQCLVAGTPGTWRATGHFVGLGPTANRPTLTANDRAVMYFDTTLDADGKPIWWSGTAWVDATGAVV